jgi:YVTN family beta-propeller protein
VAVRPDGAIVYVCNASSFSNSVSVINTATNTVIATVTVGALPYGVVFSSDSTRAYVSNISGNSVSVLDAQAHSLITNVLIGASPIGVALTPDGSQLYVAVSGNDKVNIVSTATNTMTGSISVAAGPNSLGKFIASIPNPPPAKGNGLNVGQGRPEVENPLNGVGISIAGSNGGLVQLAVDVTPLDRAVTVPLTDFDDIPGRATKNVPGTNPAHQYTQAGIFVTTAHGVDAVSKQEKGKMRRMLAISARELGASDALPAPADTTVALKSMKGKFFFNASKPDAVSFAGTVTLPAGLNLARPDGQTLTVGVGNIIDTVAVSAKGKATLPGSAGLVKKLSVKFPRLKKGQTLTAGGEKAQLTFTVSAAGLTSSGFDTEGITATLQANEDPKKGATRNIQVAVVLSGVAYEGTAPVTYKVSTKGDTGQIAGRSSAR